MFSVAISFRLTINGRLCCGICFFLSYLVLNSNLIQDVPGYMSPDSRSKILGGVIVPDKSAHASLSEETFKTQMFEDMQVILLQ